MAAMDVAQKWANHVRTLCCDCVSSLCYLCAYFLSLVLKIICYTYVAGDRLEDSLFGLESGVTPSPASIPSSCID